MTATQPNVRISHKAACTIDGLVTTISAAITAMSATMRKVI
jgi:hypothetical protein